MYIDGYTEVPYSTLRQLVCDHGGTFLPAMYGAVPTHYVAENVSYAKARSLFDLFISLSC